MLKASLNDYVVNGTDGARTRNFRRDSWLI